MHILDPSLRSWAEFTKSGAEPAARCCLGITSIAHKLFVFGGYNGGYFLMLCS